MELLAEFMDIQEVGYENIEHPHKPQLNIGAVRRSYSLRWKLHIWNIKLFHKDEWIIYPNGRMYNKQQLNDAWNNLKIDSGNVEHP